MHCWDRRVAYDRSLPPINNWLILTHRMGSAKTALMTRFLYCFLLFKALFRSILRKLTLLWGVMTLGLALLTSLWTQFLPSIQEHTYNTHFSSFDRQKSQNISGIKCWKLLTGEKWVNDGWKMGGKCWRVKDGWKMGERRVKNVENGWKWVKNVENIGVPNL